MTNCSIVEDLMPLYEEKLVQPETAQWVEQHLRECERCRNSAHFSGSDITIEETPNITPPIKAIRRAQTKLFIVQTSFVTIAFLIAMYTSLLNNSLGFIVSFFALGIVTFLFYRSWMITLTISFVPTFIWAIYQQSVNPADDLRLGELINAAILGGFVTAAIHTVFALLGGVVGLLLLKIFQKEDSI